MIIKATDAPQYTLVTLPEWTRYNGQTDKDYTGLARWSAPFDPPAIGDRVIVTFNGFGAGEVMGYFVEHAFLGVYVKCDSRPAWHVKQCGAAHPYPMCFGAEIIPEPAPAAPVAPAAPAHGFAVGDGATVCHYSDRHACTVIAVTAQSVTLRRDKATLLNGAQSGQPDALTFSPGGFVGHTEGIQRYSYAADPDGIIYRARMTKRGLTLSGKSGAKVIPGRSEHYDFNF